MSHDVTCRLYYVLPLSLEVRYPAPFNTKFISVDKARVTLTVCFSTQYAVLQRIACTPRLYRKGRMKPAYVLTRSRSLSALVRGRGQAFVRSEAIGSSWSCYTRHQAAHPFHLSEPPTGHMVQRATNVHYVHWGKCPHEMWRSCLSHLSSSSRCAVPIADPAPSIISFILIFFCAARF